MAWFKMISAIESTSLLKFNSGETQVHIVGGTQTVEWSRADATLSLDISILPDVWVQAGGFYKQDGVFFFTNTDSKSEASVAPTTGLDLVICESMSLSTSKLKLYLVSVWNSKIPLSSLKKSSPGQVLERHSSVVYL